ncbi:MULTISPECIES: PPE domain-containing protein [unclassified Rhodococcus (in: high G+C Gram-positive bacteria)]|uniref:PPE domain-containing protein n=1 Tax=unclassified Rhodococcus (in: high G+C Gram-positive bacteria) TaxID=192944 RepID=UPI00163A1A59|nr:MULTISPECIES: PPE domain-containing protein [unclassified Rhodococcus (in: high G+C Gram-positive bacteria)]MBC2641391.1 PPE family protein [Rhodococcus sp. 3A]MBC2893864.1 PPE family protein [Rhodococcus sp. 4CII]
MTMGLTGVIWLPRGATVNSTTLVAGAGPVPLSVASAAWTALSTSFVDANITLVRVMAELAAGWQGVSAVAALAKITPFTVWTAECAELAADTAAKAGLEAGAYTTAALIMPSIPEIVAVKTAKAAAYSTGGALNGTAAAAEAADRAMDIRAGLVMEGYEAASNILALQRTYKQPPRIVTKADSKEVGSFDEIPSDGEFDPTRAAAAAVMAAGQNPAVTAATSQVGSIAGTTVSTATSAASNIGGAALSAVTGGGVTPLTGAPMMSGGSYGGGSASTSAAAARTSVGAIGAGGATLPEGWGKADGLGQGARPGAPAPAPGGVIGEVRADVTPAAAARGAAGSGPMTVGRGAAGAGSQDDEERDTPDYLKNFEHFSDGRTVIPSVIGANPDHRESGR